MSGLGKKSLLVFAALLAVVVAACTGNKIEVTKAPDAATKSALLSGLRIDTHPTDQVFSQNIQFAVDVTILDQSTLRYQWQVSKDNGDTYTDLTDERAATLNLENATPDSIGNRYRVQVWTSKTQKKVASNSAEIKEALPSTQASIVIIQQPIDMEATTTTATFTAGVQSTDISDLRLQWQMSSNGGSSYDDIAEATSESLMLTNLSVASNGRMYRIKASSANASLATYSDGAELRIMSAVSIQNQPQSATTSGVPATFSVSASASFGDNVLVQWQKSVDGGSSYSDIPGATANSLTLSEIGLASSGNKFRAKLEAALGNTLPLFSDAATLTVTPNISIATHPTDFTSTNGSASFSVDASASVGLISYQWQKSTNNGLTFQDIDQQTSPTLSLTELTAADHSAKFRARVYVDGTTTEELSSVASLSVKPTITINQQPTSQTVTGLIANFSVNASATLQGQLTYQWEVSLDNGSNFNDLHDATQSTLSMSNLTPTTQSFRYRVKISAGAASETITSNVVTLTINYSGAHDGNFYVNSVLIPTLDVNGYGDYGTFHYSSYPTVYDGLDPSNNLTYQNGILLHGIVDGFCYNNGSKGSAVSDPYLGITGDCNGLYYFQGAPAHGVVAASTSLLMRMNGNLEDLSAVTKSISTFGNATTANLESPYATENSSNSSLYVPADGNMNAVSVSPGAHFDFGKGDWTIEFWIKADSGSPEHCARVFQTTDGDNLTGLAIGNQDCNYQTQLSMTLWNGTDPGWSSSMGIGSYDNYNWTHFALVRSGNQITSYTNGNQSNSIYFEGQLAPSSGSAVIGGNAMSGPSRSINAYIDDLRIVKGVALYNGTFTPPTSELGLVGLTNPRCYDQGIEVPGLDATGSGICLGRHYVAGSPSAGGYGDVIYDANGDPMNGVDPGTGRYYVSGIPAQGNHTVWDYNYNFYGTYYFISGWNASSSMFGSGVDYYGHGRWCEDKITGTYQCNNYISGEVFNEGYSSLLGVYFMSSFSTTLDNTGTGYWCNYMDPETYSYCGYYVYGIKDFTGWQSNLNYYYINGQQTTLDQDGRGSWCGDSGYAGCRYFIGGVHTSLDSYSGNGEWCGPDVRYSMADSSYINSTSYNGGTCHNYQNGDIIKGCTISHSSNYNPSATYDDGTCNLFSGSGTSQSPWIYTGPTTLSSCSEIRMNSMIAPSGNSWSDTSTSGQDGIYHISVYGSGYNVYCDMTSDGGGWTLLANAVGGSTPDSNWSSNSDGTNVGASGDMAQSFRLPDAVINAIKGSVGRYTKSQGTNAVFFYSGGLTFQSGVSSAIGNVCSDPSLMSCKYLDYLDANTGPWGIYDNSEYTNGWDGAYTAILQSPADAPQCGPDPRFGVTSYACDNVWPASDNIWLRLWAR